jgi:LppX_LprAFG lipoprotein
VTVIRSIRKAFQHSGVKGGISTALPLILLAALLPALAACGSKKSGSGNGNALRATPAVARATPSPTPQDLLNAAIANTEALKTFHFVLTHENGTTPIAQGIQMRKADGDFAKPDRFKATVSGTAAGGFAIDAKVISVGDKLWIALIGTRYLPLENSVGAAAILDPNNGVLKALRGVKSPAYAGSDRVNGVEMTIVEGTIDAGDLVALDAGAQAGKPVKGRVWIGTTDRHLYRLRLEGPLNDQEPANIVRQIDLSQFDEIIDIQPPQ